jgi:ribosomal protein L11 methyltransferase
LKTYPAVDVRSSSSDLILALVDDFGPTAVEERAGVVRIFFSTIEARDEALTALAPTAAVTAADVPDDDWARRSQQNLQPVTVGRITIAPPWAFDHDPSAISHQPSAITIVIQPSMGFGTGHHASTRLCLAALQSIDLRDAFLVDVGTGSGVLAIAADRLGAARALGIDHDPDALQSARENLALNPDVRHVELAIADLAAGDLPYADVVTANLTGALLARSAAALLHAIGPGGTLILSGLLAHERDEVCRAFAPAMVVWEREEDGWTGLAMKKS